MAWSYIEGYHIPIQSLKKGGESQIDAISFFTTPASGQVEGGLVQALGYAVSEEMIYDGLGNLATKKFGDYRIFAADEVPEFAAILVQTYEPSGPYGAKAVAEIPLDGVARPSTTRWACG